MCRLSLACGRQVGVLIDRRGDLDHVIIGDANRLWLPDIGRLRAGRGRLRGLRLVHTHLRQEPLSNDDLTDLALLRLDLVAAITLTADGQPKQVHCAHLMPNATGDQPWRLLPGLSFSELALDPIELVRSLEQEFARGTQTRQADGGEQALLVHLSLRHRGRCSEACVAELKELCRTARVTVLDTVVQQRDKAEPRYAVGRGKLDEIVLRANQLGAELLIFDPELTPAQARAISEVTELKVIDRTMLILDIFAQRAKTREGKVQVELAQLRYTLPRLVEKNTMMSRLTGGIGGRGPGETKLEINRRRARQRIAQMERAIGHLSQSRGRRRSLRQRRNLPVVSLIGYTNAGKSTLLNALTQSRTLVEDKLFATLDPTSRRLRFPRERELILTDTVGLIHELPAELMAAFRATLEELHEAQLLLHIVDIADEQYDAHVRAVEQILTELSLGETPTIMVFNKVDLLSADEHARRVRGRSGFSVSALERQSARELLQEVENRVWQGSR